MSINTVSDNFILKIFKKFFLEVFESKAQLYHSLKQLKTKQNKQIKKVNINNFYKFILNLYLIFIIIIIKIKIINIYIYKNIYSRFFKIF